MAASKVLKQIFQVDDRFRRSINVAADYQSDNALSGYVVTPLVRTLLSRVSAGLSKGALNRAWSITGPYGTGKSACAVFLCQILGYPVNTEARNLLYQEDPASESELMLRVPELVSGGFFMVPVVGSRQPMAWTLLDGLIQALDTLPERTPSLDLHREQLLSLYEGARAGSVSPVDIAETIEHTAQLVRAEISGVLGLIIVWDELGKSLEYATLNPENSDVGLLQILAETASRSEEPPIALVTILHQAFERYAAFLSPVQRREWEKVQGRFEDVAFLQSNGELLSLVDQAIQQSEMEEGFQRAIEAEAQRADELAILPKDLTKENALQVLMGCAPLHPSVALVLGRLFRSRLAQNERSLFAFLSSGEPHSFQEYLYTETWRDNGYRPFYRLDRLYDYVQAALGSGLYAHSQGKRWAEIDEALERLPADADLLDVRLVKTIGMLGMLGDQKYLKASADVLGYALADGLTTLDDVKCSLRRLVICNIAVYRRFKDAYSLWQGSDIDLDECYERGLAQVENLHLANMLRKSDYLKPYVAKRYLHETGTFRYFATWVIDLEQIDDIAERELGEADGAVVFVLPPASMPLEDVRQRVLAYSDSLTKPACEQFIFAIPHNMQGIREGFEELTAWQWVIENIAELEGDSIARRELKGRRLAARERLNRAIARCFDPSFSYASSLWIRQGQMLRFASARQLASALSDACDSVFDAAPIVKNELINRQSLSSAASAARRTLIERMLTDGTKERLGLDGYPPEASIYLSVLHVSRLHHRGADGWVFGLMEDEDPCRVRPLWEAMDRFFTDTEGESRPITDLYAILRQPPFGIKEGLLPIYFVVAMLHWSSEVALYEEGTFVPSVGIVEYERLLRAPERFAVQRYRLSNIRMRLLTGYARLFNPNIEPRRVNVLGSVRALMGFAKRLPDYTRVTDGISGEAQAVRRALFTAREPQTLLFRLLPNALNCSSLDDEAAVDNYLGRLRAALLELEQAYGNLLGEIQIELLSALRLPSNLTAARQEIGYRAGIVQDYIADMRLRAFLFRLRDDQLGDREWVESVAGLVITSMPRNWRDADVKAFRVALVDLCNRLRRAEEVALSKRETPTENRVVRLGITDGNGEERRDLLRVRPEQEPDLNRAMQAMEQALRKLELDAETELTALALLAQKMLEQRPNSGGKQHE